MPAQNEHSPSSRISKAQDRTTRMPLYAALLMKALMTFYFAAQEHTAYHECSGAIASAPTQRLVGVFHIIDFNLDFPPPF